MNPTHDTSLNPHVSPSAGVQAHGAAPILVIGAAHSGKSEYAMSLLDRSSVAAIVGTADPSENAFKKRLNELRGQRPTLWQTFEGNAPDERSGATFADLPGMVGTLCAEQPQVLVDSLNQWIASMLVSGSGKYSLDQLEAQIEHEATRFVALLGQPVAKRLVLVTSEVGAGVTPPGSLARLFRELTSRINRKVAAVCPTVVLVSAGIPLVLKQGVLPQSR